LGGLAGRKDLPATSNEGVKTGHRCTLYMRCVSYVTDTASEERLLSNLFCVDKLRINERCSRRQHVLVVSTPSRKTPILKAGIEGNRKQRLPRPQLRHFVAAWRIGVFPPPHGPQTLGAFNFHVPELTSDSFSYVN
jgi:hypothetical protein